jgi:hypothetical protein
MKVPQGVEKVLALATLSAEWRAKVLAAPLVAAADAGIELSDSEREILRAVPSQTLAGMIDSFGKATPRPLGLGKLAAGAAAAMLVSSLVGCDGCSPVSGGVRGDSPPPNPRREEPEPPPPPVGTRPDAPSTECTPSAPADERGE